MELTALHPVGFLHRESAIRKFHGVVPEADHGVFASSANSSLCSRAHTFSAHEFSLFPTARPVRINLQAIIVLIGRHTFISDDGPRRQCHFTRIGRACPRPSGTCDLLRPSLFFHIDYMSNNVCAQVLCKASQSGIAQTFYSHVLSHFQQIARRTRKQLLCLDVPGASQQRSTHCSKPSETDVTIADIERTSILEP
jgi:hypothetical protein